VFASFFLLRGHLRSWDCRFVPRHFFLPFLALLGLSSPRARTSFSVPRDFTLFFSVSVHNFAYADALRSNPMSIFLDDYIIDFFPPTLNFLLFLSHLRLYLAGDRRPSPTSSLFMTLSPVGSFICRSVSPRFFCPPASGFSEP